MTVFHLQCQHLHKKVSNIIGQCSLKLDQKILAVSFVNRMKFLQQNEMHGCVSSAYQRCTQQTLRD